MNDDAFPAEWMEKHCHVLPSQLRTTREGQRWKKRGTQQLRPHVDQVLFLIQMILFHCSHQTISRNKRLFGFVYSHLSPNVCTSLIVTITVDEAEASWWAEGVGLTPHRSTWKLKVGGVQGNAVAKRASCLFSCQRFFFPLVDVLIMIVVTGEAPANWEHWRPLRQFSFKLKNTKLRPGE